MLAEIFPEYHHFRQGLNYLRLHDDNGEALACSRHDADSRAGAADRCGRTTGTCKQHVCALYGHGGIERLGEIRASGAKTKR
jgi:hypothetical protein